MTYKIKCVICNKIVRLSRNKLTCSEKCRKIRENKKAVIKRENKKFYHNLEKEENRNCEYCGKTFIWTTSRPNKKFCSKICCEKLHNEKYKKLCNGIITTNSLSHNFYRLRFEIFKRDNFTCQYCGRNVKEDKIKLHCDHIHPESKGGLFVENNLITSCLECNLGKSDVLLEEIKLKKLKVG